MLQRLGRARFGRGGAGPAAGQGGPAAGQGGPAAGQGGPAAGQGGPPAGNGTGGPAGESAIVPVPGGPTAPRPGEAPERDGAAADGPAAAARDAKAGDGATAAHHAKTAGDGATAAYHAKTARDGNAGDGRGPGAASGGPAAPAQDIAQVPDRRTARAVSMPADFDLAPHDPLHAYLLGQAGAVNITRLDLKSPALAALKDAGVVLVVPLVSSGELIGLLNLGPRLSERGYSADDRRLLGALAGYAAPAMRVGQLVRQQQAEARDRERIEQELKVAQLIQQQFLPKSVPDLPSWHVAAFYRPARTVGGDFYDFIPLPDGRLMVVIGDVTDKGVPAALVMASTHALLRGAAPRLISPGQVLAHVNDLLCADIPAHMFVTCLALVLDPPSGLLEFANAGHDVPYVRTRERVAELRARGMPLGLMPGMEYEEKTFQMRPGDSVLLHSDGLAEAHSTDREMFGFPRVAALVGRSAPGEALIDACLAELAAFTGPGHEQEDDITLVTLERSYSAVYAEGQP